MKFARKHAKKTALENIDFSCRKEYRNKGSGAHLNRTNDNWYISWETFRVPKVKSTPGILHIGGSLMYFGQNM